MICYLVRAKLSKYFSQMVESTDQLVSYISYSLYFIIINQEVKVSLYSRYSFSFFHSSIFRLTIFLFAGVYRNDAS